MKHSGLKGFLLVLFFSALALAPAAAEPNITEVRIEDVPLIVKSGTELGFSFTVGNREGSACNAQISYWVGSIDLRRSEGNDTLYLGEGEVKSGAASVLVPSDLSGMQNFFMEMKCNETVVLANKTIEVKDVIPTMPVFGALDITSNEEGKQIEFSYELRSNNVEPVPVLIEEKIVKDNNVFWMSSQSIPLAGEDSFKRYGPVLPAGNYKLVVAARHGHELAEMTREFSVKAAAVPAPVPWLPFVALAFLLGLSFVGLWRFWPGKAILRMRPRPFRLSVEQRLFPGKDYLCLVESGSSGVAEEKAVEGTCEDAKLTDSEKVLAFEFAGRIPVAQKIRSCIVTDKRGKVSYETSVTIDIENDSNRNWENLLLLVKIPSFLSKDVSKILRDKRKSTLRGNSVIQFKLDKLDAMRSASIVYTIPKLISQPEANSIPLPIVIGYEEGEPLVITEVKLEKRDEALKEPAVPALPKERKRRARKKARKRKTAKTKKNRSR